MKKFLNSKGYTLVELLAVIIILVSVGGIIIAIVTTSLRGGNRSINVNEVRQEGNFAITQMSRMIKYAKSFDGVSADGSANSYTTSCLPITITPTPAPVKYKYLKITSFEGGVITFSCKDGASDITNLLSSNSANLINTSKVSLVEDSCYFSCNQDNSILSPIIDIHFDLTPYTSVTPVFVENTLTIPFQTSVVFRNIGN
ncbi:MAG: hypothetical protein A3B38_01135 [Candidatus Levybacteria bacterium RIFCSPLOWO2_01_FULL_36_13]|nr:MAG: hypothetical protein A2684_02375 [Candidatus Levybacteria bacterium RIFCSPHIGHO2_01_FULL_36_15b]OGH35490.1 MAG: hypothetical protein A3B38_01135 [Candidatus Levybacteria bacterium RIFCSPLOWO2_01_FULL_36_13]